MAFYSKEHLNYNRQLSEADLEVGFADYLGATIRDAWHDNPTVATIELGEVYTAQVGRDAIADIMGDSFDTETDVSEFEPTASPALSLEDQQAIIRENGLEKHIKAQEGYNAEALNLVMESKREELERQVTRQAASDWYAPAGFIAGLGTSFLDPINVASNFIPGVGQTRALRMLQEGAKEGAKGLALRRAVIGAAEGAAGSVVVEPLVALARSQQQADYGMTDSLLNVAFGTVMGATLHPALGAWGDYKRKQAQKTNPLITAPWETVAPTDKTEELRHQFAQDALAKAREAGASMTEEQAYASAALFDARARTVAYFENIDPEEYYKQHRPEFEAAIEAAGASPDTLFQFLGERGAAALDAADEASFRMDNLTIAREMEGAGRDAVAIKMAAGWERGADGKWRYEIDDSRVQVFPDGDRTWRQSDPAYARYYELNDAYGNREFTPEEEAELDALEERHEAFNEVRKHFQRALDEGKLKLKDILGADEIFAAYPEIAELPVRFGELSGSTLGAYTGEAILLNERFIGRVNTAAQLKPILLHEVQHAIQEQEGFARGGSPANMWIGQARKHTVKVYEELRKPLSLEEYARQAWRTDKITDELRADYQDYLKTATSRQADRAAQEGAAREAYRRLGGEAEARNTASRMSMTYEERLASLASSTEDVARKDQIFLNASLARGQQAAVFQRSFEYGQRVIEAGKAWAKVVADFLGGTWNPRKALDMGQTPDLLVEVGVPSAPMRMETSTFKKITNRHAKHGRSHKLTDEQVVALYGEMADPVAVLKYGDNYTVVTSLLEDGNPIIVGLDHVTGKVRINEVTSAYGKGGFEGYLKERASEGAFLYMEKNKLSALLGRMSRPQSPRAFQEIQRAVRGKIKYQTDVVKPETAHTAGDINTLLQRAWHGTPHNFDAFNLQAIGSGEGAQAHGWGLYFAQERDVSEGYRRDLIEQEGLLFGDKKYSDLDDDILPSWVNDELVREQLEGILNGSTTREEAIAILRKALADEEADARSYFDDDYQNALDEKMEELDEDELADFDEEDFKRKFERDWWSEAGEVRPELGSYSDAIDFLADSDNAFELSGNRGQLFEVEIPDNDVLLDEQKTFAEQDENVKALLRRAYDALSEEERVRFFQKLLGDQLQEGRDVAVARKNLQSAINAQRSFVFVHNGTPFQRMTSKATLKSLGYTDAQIQDFASNLELGAREARTRNDAVNTLQAELDNAIKTDRERADALLGEALRNPADVVENTVGGKLYDALAFALTGEGQNYRVASEFLNSHGIKGITYDGQQDGRCFVVFDDKAIEVIDKLYQIIGEKGAARLDRAREETVRTDNLAVAVKMAAEGKDDITIRLATGWEQGVDGKWRYEIPDGRLDFSGLKGKVKPDRYTPKGAHRSARLKDVLIMPDLYAAYPEIADIRVFTQTLPRQEAAAVQVYSDGTKVIVLNSRYAKPGKPTDEILSNIVHEVQHVIQSAEGFIQGSNPKKAGGVDRYMEVAGEAEARNAEGRMGFTPEERNTFLLSATSDVPAENMRTPDGKPLRDPRLPVEPVGPLMGREPRHALPEELPDDYDLGLPPEMPDAETPRGMVEFNPNDGKDVVSFFKNADASTLPHEMFHIFRRELADTASREGASPQSKDMWARVCEFVGAKEGEKWTVEQEEMFARAGERYLLEGKAPNVQLRGVFERMKQWFMEIYTSVDAAGLEISDTMRQVFGDMFRLSPEEADMAFRYGFGRMLEWDPSEGTETALPEMQESDDPAMQEELNGLAQQRLEEALQSVADMPEVSDAVRAEIEQELAVLDEAMTQDKIQGEVLLEAALCDMRN